MKKIVMVLTAAVLLGFLVYQGSMAFFHAETQVGAKISAGSLGIDLIESTNETNAEKTENGYKFMSVLPGAEIKSSVHVENVKEHTLYVRVTATKYWEDGNGNKLPDADASLIKLVTKDPANWIIMDDAANSNSENVYFYYRKPMKSDEVSTNLMDAIQISPELKATNYSTYQVHLSFDAEAVQSISGKDAVLSEWGAEIEFDENGNIISVED